MEDDDNDVGIEGLDSLPEEIEELARGALNSGVGDEGTPPLSTGVGAEVKKSTISPERAEALRRKVYAVGRLMRVLRTLREQHELIVRLKGVTPGHRIPPGALIRGEEGLQSELQKFMSAKELDAVNERRPQH
eukprot:Gregarina_sp_Poly_1__5199@NODE_2755_length_1756_cov_109_474837_g1641_i1_p2_GENE_NODE_2755_length_1756_cov_109_474837_g1641_i1NODE_2755_length_1756_cov_109_474837_g1641_i1_p2_ORF_typecomplete_len145_score32_54GAD/PF02938_14/5_7e02GAD/PF02938_14/0_85_NODE_2755_length_1756_cov_109_474837_g1641_i113211719